MTEVTESDLALLGDALDRVGVGDVSAGLLFPIRREKQRPRRPERR